MRQSKFNESQIVGILKKAESGVPPLMFLPRPDRPMQSSFELST